MDDAVEPREPNATPFVIALVLFLVVAVLAWVYLRDDRGLVTVQPDAIEVLDVAGDDMIDVVARQRPGCEVVERVQVDMAEDRIFVELVMRDDDGCVEAPDRDVVVTAQLPGPIGDREVVPGLGRFQLPCDADGRCRPEQ